MRIGRPGPAALECAIDVWGREGPVVAQAPPARRRSRRSTRTPILAAAKRLGAAKRPLIVAGGGAQEASAEVTRLAHMLQAPVMAYRRGRGVLDDRDPLSVNLPLGHELWGEADVVLAVGTHLHSPQFAVGRSTAISPSSASMPIPRSPRASAGPPSRWSAVRSRSCAGCSTCCRRTMRAAPRARPRCRSASRAWRKRLAKLAPQLGFLDAIRAELPEDGIFVDEVTQIGFASRLAFPVYKPRTYLSPGYQDNLGWGFATALGAQHARPDVPVVAISGDGGFMFTASEMATAMRHRIPLTTIVFADGAFGNVRRTQEERFGNRLIASDLANPDFVDFAASFGAHAERARNPKELRAALKRAFARRDLPSLIEVPVGPLPSPWEFIQMPRVRGG